MWPILIDTEAEGASRVASGWPSAQERITAACSFTVTTKVTVPIQISSLCVRATGRTRACTSSTAFLRSLRVWFIPADPLSKRVQRALVFLIDIFLDLVRIVDVYLFRVSVHLSVLDLVLVKLHISCGVDNLGIVHWRTIIGRVVLITWDVIATRKESQRGDSS